MKNEILNIYSNAKILFDNLIKRDHYLSNYTINYINLGDNNKFHSHYGQFNIFFVRNAKRYLFFVILDFAH